MKAVVLAAGKGTRLRPLTDELPKALVTIDGKPLLTHCLDELVSLDASEFVIVVGYRKEQIIDYYGDSYNGVPITYVHQEDPAGLADALLQAEPEIEDDFMVMLGDNVFRGNLDTVVQRQQEQRVDSAFLVETVPEDEASRYGVCVTNNYGEIIDVVEKPDDPPSNLVMTGFYTFSPAIFKACRLVQPSDRGEYELSDAIDLLMESGRTIDAVGLDGWRIDVGYPEDRDTAEQRLTAENPMPTSDGGITQEIEPPSMDDD
ncbi:sugar nucleotidyltransferase [Haloarcula sp. S1AR25-5A]|uniref:Sugar nucleotidyltransferase n=1 Tax=Haloarcula terrestris TaxID=2950533 RepID=A0AAE4EZ08_9EURY|nr:UTP--glucose-1-phosphate uridylyltransferase AglF [Haloarcula terrestris]MDS0222821.1 sugar nucleotidyltransferase [Haloarcula terrestris]